MWKITNKRSKYYGQLVYADIPNYLGVRVRLVTGGRHFYTAARNLVRVE